MIQLDNKKALTTGLLYLGVIACGIFAEFYVRSGVYVTGDAVATANNIISSEGIFRMGLVSDLMMIVFYLLLAMAFYDLFKEVNRRMATLNLIFVLVSVPILSINMLNQYNALALLTGDTYLNVIDEATRMAQSMFYLKAHSRGYFIAQIFFGLWLVPLGLLVIKTRKSYFHKVLGIWLIFGCVSYLIGVGVIFLDIETNVVISTIMDLSGISEMILCLWLIIKGLNIGRSRQLEVSTTG